MLFWRLLIFCFRNTIRVNNSLDLDQVERFVWPDLNQKSLQRLRESYNLVGIKILHGTERVSLGIVYPIWFKK